jgi:virginiamycin B lyase
MVLGPDGNLWFPESETNKIARLSTTSFSVTGEFSTLTPNATPIGIVVGGDGALWFTESTADKIGRITTGGLVTEYTSPLKGLGIFGIAVAPNGSLWFTERNVSKIGELIY